jgi:DNA-binding IclR family transcriptional regulator
MKSLSREIDETVDLSVQDGNMMIFIEHVIEVTQRLRAVSAVGNTFPLYSCANGKAILATMDDESVKNILPQSFSKLTPSTIKNSKKLFDELNDIRESGIAFDREEHAEGICAVGAAIADPYGRNIAISIPVPSVRFYKNEKIFSIMLLKYCKKIESALGKSSN